MTLTCDEHRHARLVVDSDLDDAAAAAIAQAWNRLRVVEPRRLELDLSAVTRCTVGGVAAVSRCLRLGRRLEEGVGVTVATDAGRQALLDSMTAV